MTGPWIVAFVALSCLVLLLAVFVLGVFARVNGLVDRIQATHDGQPHAHLPLGGLAVGTIAPMVEFHGEGLDSPLHFADAVMLFAAQGCAPCELLVDDLARHPLTVDDHDQILVWDGEGEPPVVPGWRVITRHAGPLRRLFRVDSTPFGLVLDGNRVVAATGVPNRAQDVLRLLDDAATNPDAAQQAATRPVAANG